MPIRSFSVAVLALLTACAAWGQLPDPRLDTDGSGRQVALWPPDRPFDHEHMRLALTFPDLSKAELEGDMTLTARAVGAERREMVLDCRGPKVTAAWVGGRVAEYSQADGKLRVGLSPPALPGETVTLRVTYTLDYSRNRNEGLVYRAGRENATGESARAPQVWSQGEAETNSRWFPCHDSPNEKLTTELIVTAPEGYEVCSNGRLASSAPAGTGMKAWHWVQDKPHTAYLVTLVIGKFSVVDLADEGWGRPETPVTAYVPIGREESAKTTLGGTPEMIRCFEALFDEPYPWDKYAQVCVRGFPGGMENTSATTMTDSVTAGRAGQWDSIVSHELGHQWFGDLVTCESWEHLWLNEGWATYCEALWAEHKGAARGPEQARAGYMRVIRGHARALSRQERVSPEFPAMASNRIKDPEEMFARADNPYGKGACILHMLRRRLGDEAFFKGTALYLDRHKFGCVVTDDFRRALEDASGRSLERFFDERVLRPGMPRVAVDLAWDDGSRTLKVGVEQTQRIDYLNPAYDLNLPLRLTFADETTRDVAVRLDGRTGSGEFVLGSKPTAVAVDPEYHECVYSRIRTPLDRPDDDEQPADKPAEESPKAPAGEPPAAVRQDG